MLRDGRSGVRIPVGARDFSFLQNVRIGCVPPPSPPPAIQLASGFFPRGKAAGGGTLTTHLHLAPTLRMSRTVRLLPLYAFLAWTGKAFSLDEQRNLVTHDKTSVARVPTFKDSRRRLRLCNLNLPVCIRNNTRVFLLYNTALSLK